MWLYMHAVQPTSREPQARAGNPLTGYARTCYARAGGANLDLEPAGAPALAYVLPLKYNYFLIIFFFYCYYLILLFSFCCHDHEIRVLGEITFASGTRLVTYGSRISQ